MNILSLPVRRAILAVLWLVPVLGLAQSEKAREAIPEPLRPWEGWALWKEDHRDCLSPYKNPETHLCVWPSRLALAINPGEGRFTLGITAYQETWIPLPGGKDVWPVNVKANGQPVPVVEREGGPSARLAAGDYQVEGAFQWDKIPQNIPLPPEIGILSLELEGSPVEAPAWDARGLLWLKREGSPEEMATDFLAVKLYAVVEDGIPLWLRTEVELTVSGKSREEEIGSVLPEGWSLAAVESPIPVAVDDAGHMKAQVRAGRWIIRLSAFRVDNVKELRYPAGARPAAGEELIGFRPKPDFRMVEVGGAPLIDVSQTTFPDRWRALPVYRWDTSATLKIEERMRGMGLQRPAGLQISRELWLDENGRGLTFRDRLTGQMQQIWRLDAAQGQDLGSVRSHGEGQLITRNPENGAPGIEIRTRDIEIEATGRMERSPRLPAAGWRSDADSVQVTLNLPPGWRLFALFGADWVRGDWLTAWTLLDLFLLLMFTLAVFRLWGFRAAIVGFLAFALSYHEPGAPRFIWLVLLIPLALLRVVPAGWGRKLLLVCKWATIIALVVIMAPFVARQVQQALYPQLELTGRDTLERAAYSGGVPSAPAATAHELSEEALTLRKAGAAEQAERQQWQLNSNLLQDTKALIQTGPAVPDWTWRTVTFGWNGPVQAAQHVRPILVSLPVERAVTIVRVLLAVALAYVLLKVRRAVVPARPPPGAVLALAVLAAVAQPASAQMPSEALIETLRKRLLEPSDAFPNAADIPSVSLKLDGRRLTMDVEIHAVVRTAVPLPARLPDWLPTSVQLDGKPEAALRRADGDLWIAIPAGVHRVRIEGLLADAKWEWTYSLKPRRVTIDAPGWLVTGLRPDGVPERQIFLARPEQSGSAAASYERQDVEPVAVIERNLELGLVWKVRTTANRLSPPGRAVSLRIPLLPGENVTSSAVVKDGLVEVRLGAADASFTWESELPVTESLDLATRQDDSWVERWRLAVSPVWNVSFAGLAPIFEAGIPELIPVWLPWPGEHVDLAISRPEAVAGAAVTVGRCTHEIILGKRQRTATLTIEVRSSLGEDFLIGLPAEAEITGVKHDNQSVPVRKDGENLVISLRPGEQTVSASWKTNVALGPRAQAGEVRLPVESANIETVINVPENRWILWTNGPLRGPAVRFWTVLTCSLIAAWVLGRMKRSPLRIAEWMLLTLGLTQVPLPAGLAVVLWLFFLSWRGGGSFQRLPAWGYNLLQVALAALTAMALVIFVTVVAEGLLGNPDMFILGNNSSRTILRWYQARSGEILPRPSCFSVSIWWYRFLMLVWALWLAAALIGWLRWAWQQFSGGGCFRPMRAQKMTPPPLEPNQG